MTAHVPDLTALAGRSFAAVLFDLDGTLIDSTPAVSRSWRRWAHERGLDPASLDVPHGVPARQVLAGLVPPGQIEAAFARIEQIETEDVEGIVVLPGAVPALAALPAGRVAIVTSGTAPLAMARIAAVGLAAPPVLVTADDVPLGKPHPDPYLLAARRLGVPAGECLVVEDAPAGVAAGRAAGCLTVSVAATHPVASIGADVALSSLADVRFRADPDGVRVLGIR